MSNVISKTSIIQELEEGVVSIKFTKNDGSIRTMSATLNSEYVTFAESDDLATTVKKSAQPVWDTEASAWRSFRWDSLQEVNGVNVAELSVSPAL